MKQSWKKTQTSSTDTKQRLYFIMLILKLCIAKRYLLGTEWMKETHTQFLHQAVPVVLSAVCPSHNLSVSLEPQEGGRRNWTVQEQCLCFHTPNESCAYVGSLERKLDWRPTMNCVCSFSIHCMCYAALHTTQTHRTRGSTWPFHKEKPKLRALKVHFPNN